MAKYVVTLKYIDLSDDETQEMGHVVCDTEAPDSAHMPGTVGSWFRLVEAHMKMKHGDEQRDEEAAG